MIFWKIYADYVQYKVKYWKLYFVLYSINRILKTEDRRDRLLIFFILIIVTMFGSGEVEFLFTFQMPDPYPETFKVYSCYKTKKVCEVFRK
jgi:hypothetical protein